MLDSLIFEAIFLGVKFFGVVGIPEHFDATLLDLAMVCEKCGPNLGARQMLALVQVIAHLFALSTVMIVHEHQLPRDGVVKI